MENKKAKSLIGKVVSDRMQKTRVVEVLRFTRHPKYGKFVKISKRFKAHDEVGEYRLGDRVEIQETKPISKEKRWSITKLIERPARAEGVEETL